MKRIDKRKRILEAAESIFASKGFYEASISDIAKQAKVGEATIYNYFGNKEELLVNIPIERTREAADLLDKHLEGITGALNKVQKIVWFFFDYWENHPNFITIFQLTWRVNKKYFHLDPNDLRHKLLAHFSETIQQGQKEGVIDPSLGVRLCRDLMLGIMEGMLTRWLLRRSEWSLVANANDVADIIIRAIRTPKTQKESVNLTINEVNIYLGTGRRTEDEIQG